MLRRLAHRRYIYALSMIRLNTWDLWKLQPCRWSPTERTNTHLRSYHADDSRSHLEPATRRFIAVVPSQSEAHLPHFDRRNLWYFFANRNGCLVQSHVVRGNGPTAVQSKLGYLLFCPLPPTHTDQWRVLNVTTIMPQFTSEHTRVTRRH